MIETYLLEQQELLPLQRLRKDVSRHRIGVKMLITAIAIYNILSIINRYVRPWKYLYVTVRTVRTGDYHNNNKGPFTFFLGENRLCWKTTCFSNSASFRDQLVFEIWSSKHPQQYSLKSNPKFKYFQEMVNPEPADLAAVVAAVLVIILRPERVPQCGKAAGWIVGPKMYKLQASIVKLSDSM